MIVEIKDFADIQKYQEKYNIPFTVSISTWMIEMFNQYFSEGEERIELRMSHTVLPESYQKNPSMWCNRFNSRVKFPFLQGCVKFGNQSHFIGNKNKQLTLVYIKKLKELLLINKRVTIATKDIPFSYRKPSGVIITRLRKLGFSNLKQETLQDKTIYYYDEYIEPTT